MEKWLYKWLPIIFGCHCKDERSFWYKGKKFPICARCTGELIGIAFCLLSFVFIHTDMIVALILLLPLVFDGFLQAFTRYESTNLKRVISGMLFGYGLITIFLLLSSIAFEYGYEIGKGLQ